MPCEDRWQMLLKSSLRFLLCAYSLTQTGSVPESGKHFVLQGFLNFVSPGTQCAKRTKALIVRGLSCLTERDGYQCDAHAGWLYSLSISEMQHIVGVAPACAATETDPAITIIASQKQKLGKR